MRTPHIALLLASLLTTSCLYYPPDSYYYGHPPYPPRYPHHHPRDLNEEPDTEPGNEISHNTPDSNVAPPKELPDKGDDTPPPSKTPPPPAKTPKQGDIPTATRSSKPGMVKNPFQPGQELDVSGMASGSLAKDPVSGKVFRVP